MSLSFWETNLDLDLDLGLDPAFFLRRECARHGDKR